MSDTTKVSIYEKFARDTGIMTFVHIITALRSLILLPIIAKTMDAASYGIWAQVTVTLLLVFPLCTLGLDYALNRFLPHKTDKGEIRELFFSVTAVALLSSSVIAGVILLLKNQMADVLFGDVGMASIVVIMAGTLMFRTLASVATNYFRAFRQTRTYAILSVALEVGEIGLASYLVLAGYGIQGAVYALLATRAIIFLVAMSLVIRQIGIRIPHFTNIRLYLGFSLPLMTLPLISNIAALKPTYGLRRGVEYYGSQLYQPGDSLKDIDWKHSLKYNELISKEFTEFHGQPAIILINLAVGSAEEADKLAYNIIATAISLAQEDIPTSLAAYDHEGVKITTTALQQRQLILQSLRVAQEMVTFINPVKYLSPPDVGRLRANISRIRLAEGKAARVLLELLQLEYKNLNNAARINPATRALAEAFIKVDKNSNVVVISHRNHDAEALAFSTFSLTRKGNAVIAV